MNIERLYEIFLENPSVSTDSRNIKNGSIFFALRGSNFDGNRFAGESLNLGAKYAVVDNPEVARDDRFLLVENVLVSLQNLAAYHRKKIGLPLIAITGTNGKTTTKELTSSILSKKYKIVYTKGNLNNHIGVPLTLLEIERDTELAVIEMGANHPGEIKSLCEIADPDFGLITNVGKAHIEGFGSFDGVKKTKAELYRYIEQKKGKIFINSENKILSELAGNFVQKIEYGTPDKCFMRGEIINQSPFLNIRAWFPKGILYFNSKLIGSYNFENLLAAACIGKYFNVDPLKIQEAINKYQPDNNRSQLIKKGTNNIIMDAYNANPTSMQASINNFFSLPGERKILILGDMLELGEISPEEHQNIINLLLSHQFEKAFIVGRNFSATTYQKPIIAFKNTDLLIDHLEKNPIKDHHILIKGSRGIKLEKVLESL